jgi:hypothetical protein
MEKSKIHIKINESINKYSKFKNWKCLTFCDRRTFVLSTIQIIRINYLWKFKISHEKICPVIAEKN